MRMSFSGLEIALSGLYTSQRALNIANHNIANASTPGYSRQMGEISTNTPYSVYDGTGMVGTGSNLVSTTRVRDEYLDYRYLNEATASGEWSTKETALGDVEAIFNEPSDSGFTKVMNDFYASLQELSKDPSSLAARASVKENAVSLANYFNNTSERMKGLQRDYNNSIRSKVDEINSSSQQIRDLNEQIYKLELDGNLANDLRDKRQLLIDNLSKIVNVDVNETVVGTLGNGVDDKRFSIMINGHILVNHLDKYNINYIQRTPAQKKNSGDIEGLYDLRWSDGNTLNMDGGELKAFIDVRDGNGDTSTGSKNIYKGVPYYINQLDRFVRVFSQSLNEGTATTKGFSNGYGLDGSKGTKLFTASSSNSSSFNDYSTLTASNIGISEELLGSDGAKKIACSDTLGTSGNNNILAGALEQRHDKTLFGEGAPEDFMKSLVATLGVDSQEAKSNSTVQEAVAKTIDNRRQSISGVSIDEEMASVVKYQQIYTASAKLISIMDSLYDLVVNRLGN